jgi:hypothetical protein
MFSYIVITYSFGKCKGKASFPHSAKRHFQAVAWLKAPQHWPGSEASSPLISRDRGFTCVRVEPISSPQSTTRFNQNDLELEVSEL